MARFLFTVWPFPGHIHPNVAIGHALMGRGHSVAFYTGGSVRASLEEEGFRVFPFREVDERQVRELVLKLDALSLEWSAATRRKALLCQWLLETIDDQVSDVTSVVSAWRPDVFVSDPAMWGPLLVLQEAERIPLAVMSYVAACLLPGPEGPIMGVPLPRPTGPLARLTRRLLRVVESMVATDIRRRAEAVRSRYGLPPISTSVTSFAGQMPLYLVPGTSLFDRERSDLPASVHYVGPCTWDRPSHVEAPSWLSELPRDRPLVYVTEGTMHSKSALLLRSALQGLETAPVHVVATTGQHRDPTSLELGVIPGNARLERFVPHSVLFPRTDLVVTTGGTGTVLAALSAGIPLVVVPTAWDQPENAWRVAEAGAGVRIPPGRCTPSRVRSAVDRVLSDPSFAHHARRLGADFARHRGAATAAALLEELVPGGQSNAGARSSQAVHVPVATAMLATERQGSSGEPIRGSH